MTVRLLKPYAGRPANAITSTLDPSTEAALIAAGRASADLTGGVMFFAPKSGLVLQPRQIAVGRVALAREEQTTVPLPEGQVLLITGSAGAAGMAYQLDPTPEATAPLKSWTIGAGALPKIGPFAGMQQVRITCTAGTIAAEAQDAVLTVQSGGGATKPATPAAPVLTALTSAISVAYAAPADGGSAILEAQFTDINGVSTALTGSPQTIAKAAGAPITGAVRFRNAVGWSDYSPQSNAVTPTAPAAQPLRSIATQNRPPNASESRGTTRQYFRIFKRIGSGDVDGIVWAAMGNKFSSNGYQVVPNDYTITQMATVSPGGVVVPVLNQQGGRSLTVPSGVINVQFAKLLPSAFGLTKFAVGDVYEARGYVDVPTNTGQIPFANDVFAAHVAGQQFMWCDPAATTASAVDATGPFTFTGTAPESRQIGFIPLMLGFFAAGDPVVRIYAGSSSIQGTGDTRAGTAVGTLGLGMAQLSCADADGVSNPVASINLGAANTTAARHKLNLSYDWLAGLANSLVLLLGSNDVSASAATPTNTAIQNDMMDLINRAKAAGVRIVVLGLPQPRTEAITGYPNGSNDLFKTVAGQNIPVNYDVGGQLSQLDDWLKSRVAAGVASAYFDNLSCRAGTDPSTAEYWRWVANGTENYACTDGTHRNTAFCITSAAEIRAAHPRS